MNVGAIAGALLLLAGGAVAADHEAGVPLSPSEAAGAWSLQSNGQTLCVLDFGRTRRARGFAVRARNNCAEALHGLPVAWAPTADGMRLLGADGATVMTFDRWSNSLLVSRIGSAGDLQLRRGL
jgi:hypothetical protein